MINVESAQNCCGCGACQNICPHNCITMDPNNEGFLYPSINKINCINCNLCEKVCQMLHPYKSQLPYKVLAIKNKNKAIRKESASGGLFSILASEILKDGGIVYGAAFDENWNVKHICTQKEQELIGLRGSKYLQSNIAYSYKEIKNKLKSGMTILFTGTPCQVAGLKHYLIKPYHNLYTAEIICHSIVSQKIWQRYLSYISKGRTITSINFRDKSKGWKNYRFCVKSRNRYLLKDYASENIYMICIFKGFLSRYSCYNCPAKRGKSTADITMGDFWGLETIDKKFYDPLGVSLALLRNSRIERILNLSDCDYRTFKYEDVLKFNKAIESSLQMPSVRLNLYERINKEGIKVLTEFKNISLKSKIKKRIKNLLHII